MGLEKQHFVLIVLVLVFVGLAIYGSGFKLSNIFSDPNQIEFTEEYYNSSILPKVIEYNQTKGEQNSNFTIKGKVFKIQPNLDWYINGPSRFPTNKTRNGEKNYTLNKSENITFIIEVNIAQSQYLGTKPYHDTGTNENIDLPYYQGYADYIVVYWPENKVIGWFRLYGDVDEPPSRLLSGTRTFTSFPDLHTWLIDNKNITVKDIIS